MSMFLFQVVNLNPRAFVAADLLLALCLLIAACAWLGLGTRPFVHTENARANKVRVYRHRWNSLERVHGELRDERDSDAAVRRHLREVYAFFLKNGRFIEAGDWLVLREYILTLRELRFVNGHGESGIGKGSSQSLPRAATRCATDALEVAQLRSAVRQRVSRIVPLG